MSPLDREITTALEAKHVRYTRYVDDLTFSGEDDLRPSLTLAEEMVRKHGFRLNRQKRRDWGPGDPATVTGIVLTTTLNPEREFLEALSQTLADLKQGQCDLTDEQIAGRIAWVEALNPELGAKLKRKFRKLTAV